MKRYLDKNVYEAAVERYDYIYTHFERVCISFSNGKDSGVLLNLAIEEPETRQAAGECALHRHGGAICPGR